ncbi:hypothetical protein CEXT_412341 [Caerostris extrusa]|uniref:Uncharacterized protein n=1 Tax=Caerostris extrusa TaxID=172846 RepID=A0AAV4QWI7_CAEEX|nr:hypothetical protein CEXT_412341 [Caerostris extrusa]
MWDANSEKPLYESGSLFRTYNPEICLNTSALKTLPFRNSRQTSNKTTDPFQGPFISLIEREFFKKESSEALRFLRGERNQSQESLSRRQFAPLNRCGTPNGDPKPLASIKSLSQSGSKSIFNPWCREKGETAYCCEPPLQSALIDKFHLPGKGKGTSSN